MHISSLPSDYGIGTLGKAAYDFVDDLKETGQSIWQILPVCPTGYGDSPYASYSTFAGNPYFIDLDMLKDDGLLKEEEYKDIDWGDNEEAVDYGKIYNNRFKVLDKAVERFLENPTQEYAQFCFDEQDWLEDFALFMALKEANGGKPWLEWDDEHRQYDPLKANHWKEVYQDRVEYFRVLQYLFYKQWKQLRKYANDNGVEIVGDLPIYVSLDSVDAWSHPELFALDEDGRPSMVAGCPPDGFSADGQLWGNPLYNWEYHQKTDFAWWINRIDHLIKMYNILRIDHFRGFDSYYAIPAKADSAREGQWLKGPGIELFKAMERKIGPQKIIAEDLGFLTPSVRELLKETGYPGMKILEFGFDSRDGSGSEYLPYNYPQNSYAYAGTHDNDTIQGWFKAIDEADAAYARNYMQAYNPETYNWDMMREVVASPSDTAIVQMQDLLNLDSSARMNTPGKPFGNWTWRMKKNAFDRDMKAGLLYMTKLYGRYPQPKKEEKEAEENKIDSINLDSAR